jgi:hypothetical protein
LLQQIAVICKVPRPGRACAVSLWRTWPEERIITNEVRHRDATLHGNEHNIPLPSTLTPSSARISSIRDELDARLQTGSSVYSLSQVCCSRTGRFNGTLAKARLDSILSLFYQPVMLTAYVPKIYCNVFVIRNLRNKICTQLGWSVKQYVPQLRSTSTLEILHSVPVCYIHLKCCMPCKTIDPPCCTWHSSGLSLSLSSKVSVS